MKVISIWQPFATLSVKGFKLIETRGWPAPPSVIGQTIGIASTKSIRPAQRAHFQDPEFQQFYTRLGLPALEDLPFGFLLGTVTLDSIEQMTPEWTEDVSDEEKAYGWWEEGNWGWRMTNAREFRRPIPIVGKQGLFEWNGALPDEDEEGQADRSTRPPDIRSSLRVV